MHARFFVFLLSASEVSFYHCPLSLLWYGSGYRVYSSHFAILEMKIVSGHVPYLWAE